jgi:hypothetical protein
MVAEDRYGIAQVVQHGREQDFNSLDRAEAARASLVCNTTLK